MLQLLAISVLGLAAGSTFHQDGATDQPAESSAAQQDVIDWRTDLAGAIEEAARERRPLLAVFR